MAKKQNVLLCWVGGNDIKALSGNAAGPVLSTLRAESFDQVELLSSYPAAQVEPYLTWLREQVSAQVNVSYESLTSPVHFGDIYQAANAHLKRLHVCAFVQESGLCCVAVSCRHARCVVALPNDAKQSGLRLSICRLQEWCTPDPKPGRLLRA